MDETREREGQDERDERLHASRADAAPSSLNPDRGASRLPEGPTVAPGNKGWDMPAEEAPETLEGAVRHEGEEEPPVEDPTAR